MWHRDNSFRERLLWECNLTLFKAISASHAAEETHKHPREILRSQPAADIDKSFLKKLNKSNHNTRNQNTRDFIKSVNFVIVYIPKANVLLMEKFVIFALKRTISKFAAHVLVKKYMKLKKTNLMNPPTRAIISFLLKLLIFRILHTLTKSGMKTLVNNPTLEGDFCFIQNWYRSSM